MSLHFSSSLSLLDRVSLLFVLVLLFCSPLSASFSSWSFLGPFPCGKTELEGDPVAAPHIMGHVRHIVAHGQALKASSNHSCGLLDILSRAKTCPSHFFSELAPTGTVTWWSPTLNGAHSLVVAPSIDWNALLSSLSSLVVLEFQGWLTATISVQHDGFYALTLYQVHTFYIDNFQRIYHGNIYGTSDIKSYIYLTKGKHHLFTRLRGKQSVRIQFDIARVKASAKSPLSAQLQTPLHPERLPDFITFNNSLPFATPNIISLPLLNPSNHWLSLSSVELLTPSDKASAYLSHFSLKLATAPLNKPWRVAPLHSSLILLALSYTPSSTGWWSSKSMESCITLNLRVNYHSDKDKHKTHHTNAINVALRCRASKQSFTWSYLDSDGSMGSSSLIAPHDSSSCKRTSSASSQTQGQCAVILSMSGVGASGRSMADAHKYKRNNRGDYIFGYDNLWLLAPDRNGAHNDEGMGYHMAIHALQRLIAHARYTQFNIDENRVVFEGHSRGGHGALLLTQRHPDAAMGALILSGWGVREEYGDANLLFHIDQNLKTMSPLLAALYRASIYENHGFHLCDNMQGLSVLLRTGAADETVQPFHTRRIATILAALNVTLSYTELANKGHWFWDTKYDNDGGVVMDEEIRKFVNALYAKTVTSSSSQDDQPYNSAYINSRKLLHFIVKSDNPSIFHGKQGIRVLHVNNKLHTAQITVDIQTHDEQEHDIEIWHLQPSNTHRISIDFNNHLLSYLKQPTSSKQTLLFVYIDQQLFYASSSSITNDLLSSLSSRNDVTQLSLDVEEKFCFLDNQWSLCTSTLRNLVHRSVHECGPMAQVFQEKQWAIIVRDSELKDNHRKDGGDSMNIMRYLSHGHMIGTSATVHIYRDDEITLEEMQNSNINYVLIGGRNDNAITKQWYDSRTLSFRFHDDDDDDSVSTRSSSVGSSFEFGGCNFTDSGVGMAILQPLNGITASPSSSTSSSSSSSLVLLLHGVDMTGLLNIVRYSFASNPPLSRSPFTNMNGDYAIHGNEVNDKGTGGVIGFGFLNDQWKHDEKQGFLQCTHQHTNTKRQDLVNKIHKIISSKQQTIKHDDERDL